VSGDGVRFGVNLMPPLWAGEKLAAGPGLMAQRRRLLDRMAASGLDHVMVGDHVVFHGGIGNDGLADAASVVTARDDLDVYLAVYLLSLRHPLLVARQLVTVAQFAPDRLSLGLGIGGDDRREVMACGVDPRTRGRRMNESLGLLRRLLAGEEVSHDGEFFTLDRVAIRPVPEPWIPLVVGGRSDAALRRAGRLGDGWLGIWTSAARCADAIAAVAGHAAEAGRTGVDWRHGMTFWCGFGASDAEASRQVAEVMEGLYRTPFDRFQSYVPRGTAADIAEFVAPYVQAGCTTLNFIPFAESSEAAIDSVAEVREILKGSV
jgi:alkanesulfonate monooxygenase SsuD/methylene tetrahydromethanopterin reductase-like flavin-dependent oxidoreductase (luciferase family)